MQQTDVGIDASDNLTVQIQNQAQHTMRGRVLRPKIQSQSRLLGFGAKLAVDCDGAHGFLPGSPDAAPGAIAAFSSPGRIWGAPSQGLMKSKSRNSCTNCTGW